VCSKYLARSNSLPNFSIVSLCIMQPMRIRISLRLTIICALLRVKMWKYCVLTLKKHYPAWIRVFWCIACQNRLNGLSSRSVDRFCVQRKKFKKLSANFGYMGRSNPWSDLDQKRYVARCGGRNHVCNIRWLSVKGCGCCERNNFALSHWLEVSPLQHWSHYRVTVWSHYRITVWFQGHGII